MVVAVAVLVLATLATAGVGIALLAVAREIEPARRACADAAAALGTARSRLARDRAALTGRLDRPAATPASGGGG